MALKFYKNIEAEAFNINLVVLGVIFPDSFLLILTYLHNIFAYSKSEYKIMVKSKILS